MGNEKKKKLRPEFGSQNGEDHVLLQDVKQVQMKSCIGLNWWVMSCHIHIQYFLGIIQTFAYLFFVFSPLTLPEASSISWAAG